MPVDIREEDGIATMRVTGHWDRADADHTMQAVVEMSHSGHFEGTILDLTVAQVDLSVAETLAITAALGQQLPHTARHAVVIPEGSPLAETARFAESVAVNRGIALRFFSEVASAIPWIHECSKSRA